MTQCDAILDYIKTYGEITQLEALQEIGCMRLASRVNDLRRQGVPIITTQGSYKNYKGVTKHFAVYKMKEG